MTPNQKAFLDMLAHSEGTFGIGDDGYNVLVGSTPQNPLLFDSYDDHPRILNRALDSTAAGRYQELAHNYDHYKGLLDLPDFSPDAQDAIALQQIKETHALDDIEAGRFQIAVSKCAHLWASLPGAGYGQHENSLEKLRNIYIVAGGTLATRDA